MKPDALLDNFKKAFTRSSDLIHLNNAGLAPICAPAAQAVTFWLERLRTEGMHCNNDYMAEIERSRAGLAGLIGCHADELAFFQSTAGAISQVAFGMELKLGDEVLTWDQEYGSNLYPWKAACDRAGATLRTVACGPDYETPVARLLAAITARTRVIALSWFQFQTGAVTALAPLAQAARERGIWTVVDIIQGLGQWPFDFRASGVDAVCGGSHKWLTSPVGVGFLALRAEHLQKLKPLSVGSSTYGTCDDPASLACLPKMTAARFEPGSKAMLEIVALGAACELLRETGVPRIQSEVNRLATHLHGGLRDLKFNMLPRGADSGGIVSVALEGSSLEDVCNRLTKRRVSFARRGPGLRLSPHAFNTDAEIDEVLALLR